MNVHLNLLKKVVLDAAIVLSTSILLFSCDIIDTSNEDTTDGGSAYSQDSYEANNDRGSAASITLEEEISATLHTSSDLDWYVFTTDNNQQWDWVQFSITEVSGFRAELTVYDEQGNQVFRTYGANEGSNLTYLLATEGGTYYAEIESYYSSDLGTYSFSVANLDTNDAYEPNETRDDAYELDTLPMVPIMGRILSGNEKDWYTFTSENMQEWDWLLFSFTDVSSDIRIEFTIYDQNGDELVNTSSTGEGADVSRLMPTTGGTFYAMVESYYSGDTGSYTLSIQNLDTNDIYEPNESRDSAYDLGTLPVENVYGRILSGSETDWYSFTTSNDSVWDWIRFSLTDVTAEIRPEITVYDETGAEVFGTSGSNEGAGISHLMTSLGGTYSIAVESYYSSDTGSYTLSIQNLDTNDVYEPNDEQDSAYTITTIPSASMAGAIVGGEDKDWYSCEVNAGQTLQVSLIPSSSELRLEVEFFKADGTSLGSSSASSSGADLNTTFTNSGSTAGTIYFVVQSYYSNGHGDYTLSLQ